LFDWISEVESMLYRPVAVRGENGSGTMPAFQEG
jgi:hypothetical protein